MRVDLGDEASLRRHRGVLHVVRLRPAVAPDFAKPWRSQRRLAVPELGGVLDMERCRGVGIDLNKLLQRPVTLRVRRGGETTGRTLAAGVAGFASAGQSHPASVVGR